MKLSYGLLHNPFPIPLPYGTVRKPTLSEIAQINMDKTPFGLYGIGFEQFYYYETLLNLTPEIYYTKILKNNGGVELWDSFTDEEKSSVTLFDLICCVDGLKEDYVEMLNFFFVESVAFVNDCFVVYNGKLVDNGVVDQKAIRGVITKDEFYSCQNIIQQVCGIYEGNKEEDIGSMKFKDEITKQRYIEFRKRIAENEAKNKTKGKVDKNLTIPNIISVVSNKHPNLNPVTVYNLTLFQLLDSFNRLQTNTMFEIESTRVSVWGDENKEFKFSRWYENKYDE